MAAVYNLSRDVGKEEPVGEGLYAFTVDWCDQDGTSPFAEFPEQHKQMHVIQCHDGAFRARPNNMLRYIDPALYDLVEIPKFKAQAVVYRAEE
jgi:hypothetical protein